MICAYIRVSSKKQLDGVSLETQQYEIGRYALSHNFVKDVNEIIFYIDKGKTASNTKRSALQKLLDDIRKRQVQVLMIFDVSRLSRNVVDSNVLLDEIEKYKVNLIFVSQKIDRSNASASFQANVEFSHNQFESERAKEKTNKGLVYIVEKQRRCPLGGRMPIGWKRDENKNWLINEKEAKHIRKAVQMILKREDDEKVVNYMKKHFGDRKKWNVYILERFLSDRRLSGEFLYKGKLYYDVIPAIISKEEQKEALAYLRLRKDFKRSDYLFEGLLYCKKCGNPMLCTCCYNSQGDKYFYYYCKDHKKNVSQKNLIQSIDIEDRNKAKKRNDQNYYTREINKLRQRIERIKADYISENYTEREFITLIAPLDERMDELLFLKAGVKLSVTKDIPFYLMSDKNKKQYLHANIAKIIIDPETKEITKIIYKD